MSVVFC